MLDAVWRTNKSVVIGIRQRGGDVRFFHAEDAKTGTLARYIQENISSDVDVIVTDDLPAYRKAVGNARHETVNHTRKEYVRLGTDIHTNTVESAFSLLKRGIIGTWHRISAKHLAAYLDEMQFRFSRRNRTDLFLDTLRHMVTADPLTFGDLTASSSLFLKATSHLHLIVFVSHHFKHPVSGRGEHIARLGTFKERSSHLS